MKEWRYMWRCVDVNQWIYLSVEVLRCVSGALLKLCPEVKVDDVHD